ncbi:UBC-like protein [Mycena rosella]|uniref:UBC-like protein n=1 Tax=Mycena rosella TaxID=1033263 RepID=A0AAD7DP25_MYCRO|nr:UBC-like protein [Mycena rosella]
MASLNKNNSAVKRIMQEARELANDPSPEYSAAPLEDDIFEWHCTLRGPAGTEFEGGLYHFRILLPAEYPFRPPSLMMLTPNGRFETDTKICISFTSYHEELWQPAWGVRTAIIGLQGFFPLKGKAAVGIGSIEFPTVERKRLAALSRTWVCPHCQETNITLLPDPVTATLGRTLSTTSNAEQAAPSDPPAPVSEPTIPEAAVAEGPNTPHAPNSVASPAFIDRVADPTAATRITQAIPKRQRPPILLDTAICVMLVLVCIVFRRML